MEAMPTGNSGDRPQTVIPGRCATGNDKMDFSGRAGSSVKVRIGTAPGSGPRQRAARAAGRRMSVAIIGALASAAQPYFYIGHDAGVAQG
jgi:hypothetical protein